MNICVFTSAKDVDENYRNIMYNLGKTLGAKGHTLVFGGYDDGLMGCVASGFQDAGAEIIGVFPDTLEDGRLHHKGVTHTIHTKDLNDRKTEMLKISDCLVAAPGGIGTLDELFSAMASKYVGEYKGEIVVYNALGYFDKMLSMLDDMEEAKFANRLNTLIKVTDDPDRI